MKFFEPYYNRLLQLLLPLGMVFITGCLSPPDCTFQEEPILSLSIYNEIRYTEGHALKDNLKLDGSNNFFRLPISMNDNRMVYIFTSSSGTDTLELIYTKKIQYKDKCGFVLGLDITNGDLSTFSSININRESIQVQ